MPRAPQQRVPFDALERLLRSQGARRAEGGSGPASERRAYGFETHPDDIEVWLDISAETRRKYRQRGLSMWLADELCARVDLHPAEVWPAEYAGWEPPTPLTREQQRARHNATHRTSQARRRAALRAERKAQEVTAA